MLLLQQIRQGRDSVFRREDKTRLKIKPLYGTRVDQAALDNLIKVKAEAKLCFVDEIKRLSEL